MLKCIYKLHDCCNGLHFLANIGRIEVGTDSGSIQKGVYDRGSILSGNKISASRNKTCSKLFLIVGVILVGTERVVTVDEREDVGNIVGVGNGNLAVSLLAVIERDE